MTVGAEQPEREHLKASAAPKEALRRINMLPHDLGNNWKLIVFWLLLFASLALITAILIYSALSAQVAVDRLPLLRLVLVGNALLLFLLSVSAAIRFYTDSRRGRRHGKTEAKIHRSFVLSFTGIAILPTIMLSSLFTTFYFVGIEQRFAPRIDELMRDSRITGRAFLQNIADDLSEDAQIIRTNLSTPGAVEGLQSGPILYNYYLAQLAQRLELSAIYVFDSNYKTLARTEKAGGMKVEFPRRDSLAEASNDFVPIQFFEMDNYITALLDLPEYEDAYLFVVREYSDGLLTALFNFSQVVIEYDWAKETAETIRPIFIFGFVQAALGLILAAFVLGLSQANAIARPVGRLADAAALVTQGDLTVRLGKVGRGDEIEGLIDAFNRMTEQLQSQRLELVNSRDVAETRSRFIETVLSGVGAGVLALDADRQVVIANPPATEILQSDHSQLVGKRLDKAVPEFAQFLDRIVHSEIRYQDEEEHRIDLERDNRTVHLRVRGGRYQGLGGREGYILTFDDLSSFVMAQRQVAWRDVARRVAHEIRNPLTPIQLSAQRLNKRFKDLIPDEKGREIFEKCTDTILRQVADIGRMVGEFAEFARMPTAQRRRTNLTAILTNCVFDQRLRDAETNVEYIGPKEDVYLELDERLMGQAIANLLKNAGESIIMQQEAGGRKKQTGKIELHLKLDTAAQYAQIDIVDNGAGLPEKERDRLTEPYITHRKEGSGLGLAIVRRIIEDHDGRLQLFDRTELNENSMGARIVITLPIKGAEAV